MMLGETQALSEALLPRLPRPSYFPVPPPPSRSNTLYASWKDWACTFDNLPLWKQDSSRSISWAAKTYDCLMTPAYLYDRFIYRICCCGNRENCNDPGGYPICEIVILGLNLPKIPCVVLSGAGALFSGIAGSVGDCVAPQRMLIDEPVPLSFIAPSGPYLTEQIDSWIEKDNLSAVINFFIGKDNKLDQSKISLLNRPILYPKKVFLICLAIRCPDERINFETRRDFIFTLLDHEIVNGYNSAEGWITAPLLEATRSNYRYASDLLELLCVNGLDTFKPCGVKEKMPYVPLWVYSALLENENDELFYRATLLISYAIEIPKNVKSFLEEKQNAAYKNLHAKVTEAAIPPQVRAKRGEILNVVNARVTRSTNVSIAKLICQYSALFSPVAFTGEQKLDRLSIVRAKAQYLDEKNNSVDLNLRNCFAIKTVQQETKIEEKEPKTQKVGLSRYSPLPDYEPPAPAPRPVVSRYNERPTLGP